MKKYGIWLLSALLFIGFTLIPPAASSVSEMISVHRNLVAIEVNEVPVAPDNFLYQGTTYIPMRAVAELLDKEVGWNTYTKVASINDRVFEREKLSQLLPGILGYTWLYDGYAEYSHEMELRQIIDEEQKRTYVIEGEVGDASGGESTIDRNIRLRYIIDGNSLIQEKTERAMLDSKFDRLTLIKTPLEIGTFWPEQVTDRQGNTVLMNAYIQKIELTADGKKEYTVKYQDTASDYFEVRVIKEGVGVVFFEKLLELEDTSFPAGYFLFTSGELKNIPINLYFPDQLAEKVHLEVRTLLIEDSRTARGAILALIDGPRAENLTTSIPPGTELLNINIRNRICYVDFSREFIDNHQGGTAGELMTLASIVNTLTDFDTIDRVQILVEGQSGTTLGHIILDRPLQRMSDLIAR